METDRAGLISHLPSAVRSAGEAREFVAAALRSWACADGLIDDVVLVVSELVTNAVEHGGGDVTVDLSIVDDQIVLRVRDQGAGAPVPHNPDPLTPRNRGLVIVAAVAADWGWQIAPGGKWVWAEFPVTRVKAAIPGARPPAHH